MIVLSLTEKEDSLRTSFMFMLFLAVLGLVAYELSSSCAEQGLLSSCRGFSCCATRTLRHVGFRSFSTTRAHSWGPGL